MAEAIKLKRGLIIEVNLDPTKGSETSIADCLQTRPIDYGSRGVDIRGELEPEVMIKIDLALRIVFAL
ncbi:hypothetical protein C7B67_19540 [filamentous cyanobacterium Phorm 6]|nr:hypothetical protein C7B67_19540 [filamentous cyanobacterium Phorm 6]